jgi:hypothetical protein
MKGKTEEEFVFTVFQPVRNFLRGLSWQFQRKKHLHPVVACDAPIMLLKPLIAVNAQTVGNLNYLTMFALPVDFIKEGKFLAKLLLLQKKNLFKYFIVC